MDRLHRSDDIHLTEAPCIVRVHHLHMFDAMTKGGQVIFFLIITQLFICIQYFMIGAIANGVNGHSQAYLRGLPSMLEKFLAIHVEDATIIFFANIRLEHRGSVGTERSIHKRFDRTDAQPIIAEAGAQTKLISLIEQFYGEVFEDPQLESSLCVE